MPTLHTSRDAELSACALCSISGPAELLFWINCADRGLQDILPQFPSLPVFELFLVFKSRHCNGVQPSQVLNLPFSPVCLVTSFPQRAAAALCTVPPLFTSHRSAGYGLLYSGASSSL